MISRFELFFLKRLLRHSCPDPIPYSDEKGKRFCCYVVELKSSTDESLLLVNEISDKGFIGKYYNAQDLKLYPACVPIGCTDDVSKEIVRYIGTWKFPYQSVFKCVLHDWTYYNRIPIIRDAVDQFFFNRRDLALKEKTKALKVLVKRYREEPSARFNEVKLVEFLHGRRWAKHPDRVGLQAHARLLLDSLRDSGELQVVEDDLNLYNSYELTGKALTTLETYEQEAIRHEQIISQSRDMKWLTVALIIVGLIQALVAFIDK